MFVFDSFSPFFFFVFSFELTSPIATAVGERMASIYGDEQWRSILLSMAKPVGKELIPTGSLQTNGVEVRLTFDARDRVYVNVNGDKSTYERNANAELIRAGDVAAAAGAALRMFGPPKGMRAPLVGAAVAQGVLDRQTAVEFVANMKSCTAKNSWYLNK